MVQQMKVLDIQAVDPSSIPRTNIVEDRVLIAVL